MSDESEAVETQTVIQIFCTSSGLSQDTAAMLLDQHFMSLDHLKAMEEADLDQLGLPLGEKVLLRLKVAELKGRTTPQKDTREAPLNSRGKSCRHEYTGATYRNDVTSSTWTRGTLTLTPTSINFLSHDNKVLLQVRLDDVYHVKKSNSSVWPFRTTAISIYADNIEHKIHLGRLRDNVYEKLSLFFESHQFKV